MSRTNKDSKKEKESRTQKVGDPDFKRDKPRGGHRNEIREAEAERESEEEELRNEHLPGIYDGD